MMDQLCNFYEFAILMTKRYLLRGLVIAILILITHLVSAQNNYQLEFRYFQDKEEILANFPREVVITDSVHTAAAIQERLFRLYDFGYLFASFIKSTTGNDSIRIDFDLGELFQFITINSGNLPDEILNRVGLKPNEFNGRPFSYQRISKVFREAASYAENNGYPFATVRLDSIEIGGSGITASFTYQSGPQVVFDSLVIIGSAKVKTRYLMSYLGIYKGKPYEEELISGIEKKVRLLPYIRLENSPEVIIERGKCTIKLNLSDEKVNHIDGIIGILPNEQADNKLLITGQLDLDLQNLFGSGKQIIFQWQRFYVESQMLKAGYVHPNLFRTPVNFRMTLDLLKQDSSYLNRSIDFELSLLSKNGSFVGFQTKFYNSSLISTSGLDGPEPLQENADNKITTYGLKYQIAQYDDIIFPTRGWGSAIQASVGQKKIIKNPALSDEYYNGMEFSSLQYAAEAYLDKYWKMSRQSLIKSRFSAGYVNAGQLFVSDKYRLGGLNTIRGFAEKSFFVTAYGLLNLEARALFGKKSYVMAFFDQAIIDDWTIVNSRQYIFGTGAGLSFDTSAGQFSFVFGLGKSDEQPLGLNYSRIHFGYISRF